MIGSVPSRENSTQAPNSRRPAGLLLPGLPGGQSSLRGKTATSAVPPRPGLGTSRLVGDTPPGGGPPTCYPPVLRWRVASRFSASPVGNRSSNPGLSPAFSHHLVAVPPACYPPVTRRTTPWKDGQRQRRIRCPCSSKTHRENAVHVARCLWHLFRRHVPLHLPSPPLTLHADFSFTFS
jgi:hypothetical protein